LIPLLYLLAWLNAFIYVGYFLLWAVGIVDFPDNWDGGIFVFIVAFVVCPLMPIAALEMRYRFDLLTMSDGTSMPSRIIWSILSVAFVIVMLYSFYSEMLRS
jgi:hypothetical protein